jgi:hypothetical protein
MAAFTMRRFSVFCAVTVTWKIEIKKKIEKETMVAKIDGTISAKINPI